MLLLLSLLASAQALPIDNGNSPTLLQYVVEAVMDVPNWSHYLPDDIDVDKDGNLSETEVELTFKNYVKDVFDQLDKDMDNLVTRDEFRNASIDLNGINKIIDIAMQSYPIKTFLGFGDRNQDGFIAEDDFLIPENSGKLLREYYKEKFGDKLPEYWGQNHVKRVFPTWTLKSSVPVFKKYKYDSGDLMCFDNFGEKEAKVLCREMGHEGVESVSSISFEDYNIAEGIDNRRAYMDNYDFMFDCEGTEANLEECTKTKKLYSYGACPNNSKLLASVNCTINKEIGNVELAGGKDASSGDLHIGLEKYCGDISPDMAKVVCTELGYVAGTPLLTRNNFFTSRAGPPSKERRFECNGSEQKLQDCQAVLISASKDPNHCYGKSNGIICKPGEPLWEKYAPLPEARTRNHTYYNDGKGGFYKFWEEFARYLFVADTDGDHKASMDELKTNIKTIVASMFHVLDQTEDGVFSTSDLTTLNVRLPDVVDLARELFQVLARGEQQIDLYNYRFRPEGPLSVFDYNQDNIINLKDLSMFTDSSQVEGLLTILSRELDANQDGIILVTELDNYVKGILDHLGGGTLTLDTVWKLMKESQFTCLQINGIRTVVEAVADTVETQSKKMLDYFFRELDLDGNGEIPVEELYNAHVPCDEFNHRNLPNNDSDRVGCGRVFEEFIYSFPEQAPRLDRFSLSGRSGPDVKIMEKIANAACVAMQPDF